MSSVWANIDLEVICDSREEAERVSAFFKDVEAHPYLELESEVECKDGRWEVYAYLGEGAEIGHTFDQDLEDLWNQVFTKFGKRMIGAGVEGEDNSTWVIELSSEGVLDSECVDFVRVLSIDRLREIRKEIGITW